VVASSGPAKNNFGPDGANLDKFGRVLIVSCDEGNVTRISLCRLSGM
jgi:hypothetical protein